MSDTNSNDSAQLADTYGWDTTYAIPISAVNQSIKESQCSPKSFSQVIEDGISIEGEFGDWAICTGGDAKILRMSIPIPSMTLVSQSTPISLTHGEAIIQVQLHYIPHTEQPTEVNRGEIHNLVVKYSNDGSEEPVVVVVNLHFDQYLDPLTLTVLEEGIGDWLNTHLEDFTYVFATVNIGRTASDGAFQWMLPTYTSYAYIDGENEADSVLGILSMTGGRSPKGLFEQLSTNAIPQNSQAGFLISQERFLSDIILPSLPQIFPGSSIDDYILSEDKLNITLNSPVDLQEVESDGSTYQPNLEDMTISIVGQQVTIYSHTVTEIIMGINSHCESTSTYEVTLVNQSDQSATLGFQVVGNPVVNDWTTQSVGVEITEDVLVIVGVVVSLVLATLTDGATLIISMAVVGLLVGTALVTPNLIATIGTDDAPTIDNLLFNATDPIVWTDQHDFTLNFAGLNQSLQLGGILFPDG